MNWQRGAWLTGKVARFVMLGLLVSCLGAQVTERAPLTGYPEDWTHHRIKFTLASLEAHPEIAGREPRAIHQLYRQWLAYRMPMRNGIAGMADRGAVASRSDWSVSLGGGKVAFGQYPAKWVFTDTTANCSDFVVFALNVAGATGGQASLVGLTNLYSGATGSPLCGVAPTVKFAYNTTTNGGTIGTSPVLSLDGKKVAFVESSGTGSVLHVLQLGTTGNNGSSPTASVLPGTGNNATMIASITYSGNNNTRSSPWVDYNSDTLYVCANDGKLYKFTGVFNGAPAVVNGGGWPVALAPNNYQLTGPVFDNTTGNGVMYMADNHGNAYAVQNILTTPGPIHPRLLCTTCGGAGGNAGVFDAPSFDVAGTRIFVVTSNAIADNNVQGATVLLLDDTSNSLNISRKINIGAGATVTGGGGNPIYDGDFDNAYYTSADGTGHLVVCGTGATTAAPYLYSVPITTGSPQLPGPPTALAANATNARCGPVTEYFNPNINGGTDFHMLGVTTNCRILGNLGAGCVVSLQNGTTMVKAVEQGGTSGIIIDNDLFTGDPGSQASSLYFTRQNAQGGLFFAVKLNQLNLD